VPLGTHLDYQDGRKEPAHWQNLFKVDPLAGSRFVSERLNPSAFAGNGGLDKVRDGLTLQALALTLVILFNLQP